MNHIEAAIKYVRENKTWTEEEDARALAIINDSRCGIERADMGIATEIRDLMDEYGNDNGLEEDWYEKDMTIDDIFFKMAD